MCVAMRGCNLPDFMKFLFFYLLFTISLVSVCMAAQAQTPPVSILHLMACWDKKPEALERLIYGAKALGYQAVMLEIGGNVQIPVQGDAKADWSLDEMKALLQIIRDQDLEVIPCVSFLGHPEVAPRNPQYFDPSSGVKIWEPGVYDFIDKYIAQVCNLFEHPRYFHVRFDESRDCVKQNSEHMQITPRQVLAQHITRVNEIVKRHNARMIMWHDMLLTTEAVQIATALGGPPLNCWEAVDDISRDVIINFWLYDFYPVHAPGPEFFTARGFEVWLSPWMVPEAMCDYAAEYDMSILETTWCGPFYDLTMPPLLHGMGTTAYRRANPAPEVSSDSAILRAVKAFTPTLPLETGQLTQVPLPYSPADDWVSRLPSRLTLSGSVIDVMPQQPLQLEASLGQRLKTAKYPLRVVRADGVGYELDGVNCPRGEGALILYTEAIGATSGTNIFGMEIAGVGNVITDVPPDVYGIGNQPIPPGGFVLSAHTVGQNPSYAFIQGITSYSEIKLLDAQGDDLLEPEPAPVISDNIALLIDIPEPVSAIWLLHYTRSELPVKMTETGLRGPQVAHLTVNGNVGNEEFSLRFRRDVCSFNMPRVPFIENNIPAPHVFLAWSHDDGNGQVRCLWATKLTLSEPQKIIQLNFQPSAEGFLAGWTLCSVALEH